MSAKCFGANQKKPILVLTVWIWYKIHSLQLSLVCQLEIRSPITFPNTSFKQVQTLRFLGATTSLDVVVLAHGTYVIHITD